jgi:hypothetical protein
MKKILFLLTAGLLLYPVFSQAAVLYLQSSEKEYRQGDVFIVDVRIDAEEECVNAIEAVIGFPGEVLEARSFSTSNSLISVWLSQPRLEQDSGLISFAGGVPGGFCGILPGDPGESNLLLKVIFMVKETEREKRAEIRFSDNSQVLLNDGFGTKAEADFRGIVLNILPGLSEASKDEWEMELLKDTIPPEPFEIEIVQDSLIFDGNSFIVFQVHDKQTGVDYYEVKEGNKEWQKAESPYLLGGQELNSTIRVKAVDKAGNERVVQYLPEKKPYSWWLIIIPTVLFVAVLWFIIKRRR